MSKPAAQIPQPPSVVFVDAGGVLVLPDLHLVAQVLELEAEPFDRLYNAFFHAYEQRDTNRPERLWLWEAFARHFGIVDPQERIAGIEISMGNLWIDAPTAAPGAVDFLRHLNNKGVPVVIVSNSDGNATNLLERCGICQVGDGPAPSVVAVIDSYVVGVAKPNPRIFEIAAEAAGNVDLEKSAHVGDALWSDVRGAMSAGVPVLHFDPAEACVERDSHRHVRDLTETLAALNLS